MNKKLLLLTLLLTSCRIMHAQYISLVSGLRLYEHHSPTIAGTQGADGTQSGYDFVSRRYYNSFNTANFGKYLNGEEANIDMVEHNGPYGNQGSFGFTSGMSNIWINEIQGNGITKWMKAPAAFDYNATNNLSQIIAAYNAATATQSISAVETNTTYLARIRNTGLYVAMRVTAVKNKTTSDANVYFDFSYKYGPATNTGINNVSNTNSLYFYPNPAHEKVIVENKIAAPLSVKIIATNGQTMQSCVLDGKQQRSLDLSGVASGLYFIIATTGDGHLSRYKMVRQ